MDADLSSDQVFKLSDIIVSTCAQNESSSYDVSNYPRNNIDTKKEVDTPRDIEGHKLSPYERYCCQRLNVIIHT